MMNDTVADEQHAQRLRVVENVAHHMGMTEENPEAPTDAPAESPPEVPAAPPVEAPPAEEAPPVAEPTATGEEFPLSGADPFLTYDENPLPEKVWHCSAGHEMRVKGPHTPPTLSLVEHGLRISTGPICFICLTDFMRANFKMVPVDG
jgi:hypothetical protein